MIFGTGTDPGAFKQYWGTHERCLICDGHWAPAYIVIEIKYSADTTLECIRFLIYAFCSFSNVANSVGAYAHTYLRIHSRMGNNIELNQCGW